MSTLTLRLVKGTPLTNAELDANFSALNTDKLEVSAAASTYAPKTGTGATGNWGIAISGNAATATALQTARTIGGVSFNGAANINLPGVNIAGTQSTSGNAATATVLATTRAINGTNFNGSAAITTANWGTARTITIGNTGKSVNGSANVSWTLPELGVQTSTTGSEIISAGTTAQRDASPAAGYFRFNTTLTKFEGYDGTVWGEIGGGGGAKGGGTDDVFYENSQVVTANYTIPVGKNAMSTGEITINSGVVVTISAGSTWAII